MKKLFAWYVIPCLILHTNIILAQPNISGTINSYARVTAINPNDSTFAIDNLSLPSGITPDSAFGAGKRVLIIQMKGARVRINNNVNFGQILNYNNAGNYEVAEVAAFSGTAPNYTIKVSTLFRNYEVNGFVQIVSVPTYTDVIVNGDITPLDWDIDEGRGGIIVFDVENTLTLRANITADGAGFSGGDINADNDAGCIDHLSFRSPTSLSDPNLHNAQKGEGIADYGFNMIPGLEFSRAPMANGGGGGNSHNAGGGGGSNFGLGGKGGIGFTGGTVVPCPGSIADGSGLGGYPLDYNVETDKIFLGGGGGGGQQNNNAASVGSDGGGIIIIRAQTLTTDCIGTSYSIQANGVSSANSSGGDGAGGGGAGGVVYLEIDTYNIAPTCELNLLANGGNGGNVNFSIQQGGGGGGGIGAILLNGDPPEGINVESVPGTAGKDCIADTCTATGQTGGESPSGSPFQSGWSLENTPNSLPIRLRFFTAIARENYVEVLWTTLSEINTSHFEIEKTRDFKDIEVATRISALGAGHRSQDYHWKDYQPFDHLSYYRLKSVDLDGQIQYSPWTSVSFLENQPYRIYPNPAATYTQIEWQEDNDELVSILLYDMQGRVFYDGEFKQQTILYTGDLPRGMYLLKLTGKQKSITQKLIVE